MLTLIFDNCRKNFYREGDKVIQLSSGEEHIVEKVLNHEKKILTTNGMLLDLTPDIKGTKETLSNAKVIDKRRTIKRNLEIRIKYFDADMPKIVKMDKGDWFDLRSMRDVELKAGEYALIPLGIAMQLPKGYEAYVIPRSSTYKNYKIIQTNHVGLIDESYCGDNDMLYMPVFATHDTKINKYDRICQFRIQRKMHDINIKEVEILGNEDRKGIGSTGVK